MLDAKWLVTLEPDQVAVGDSHMRNVALHETGADFPKVISARETFVAFKVFLAISAWYYIRGSLYQQPDRKRSLFSLVKLKMIHTMAAVWLSEGQAGLVRSDIGKISAHFFHTQDVVKESLGHIRPLIQHKGYDMYVTCHFLTIQLWYHPRMKVMPDFYSFTVIEGKSLECLIKC